MAFPAHLFGPRPLERMPRRAKAHLSRLPLEPDFSGGESGCEKSAPGAHVLLLALHRWRAHDETRLMQRVQGAAKGVHIQIEFVGPVLDREIGELCVAEMAQY